MVKRIFKISGITLFGIVAFALFTGLQSWNENDESNPERDRKLSNEPYGIRALTIPEKISFAGEPVPLDRIDIRERMDRELTSNTYFHSNTLLLIKRANRYFPVLDSILQREGVPNDFKYLALIESSLDVRSLSPMGAAGIWQFLKTTGQEYGLEVNDEVDERFHLEKSTRAACKFLKAAYTKYGSWTLAAASYNIGQKRITDELERQKVTNYYDMYLVSETSRYLFRILAIKEILKHPGDFGFILKHEDLYPFIETDKILIKGPVLHLGDFANEKGISYGILKELNPWLRNHFLTNKTGKRYIIEIPVDKNLLFNKKNIDVYQKNWITD